MNFHKQYTLSTTVHIPGDCNKKTPGFIELESPSRKCKSTGNFELYMDTIFRLKSKLALWGYYFILCLYNRDMIYNNSYNINLSFMVAMDDTKITKQKVHEYS